MRAETRYSYFMTKYLELLQDVKSINIYFFLCEMTTTTFKQDVVFSIAFNNWCLGVFVCVSVLQ